MEAYIRHGGLPPSYRCDKAVIWTYDRWVQEGESHLVLGICNIIFGIVCIILYIPCCIVLLQPEMRAITAYKFLFLLACLQMIGLIQNSIFSGIFFIQGVVYCNYPELNYFIGCTVMGGWSAICMTCFLLGISRLLDLWSPAWHDACFGGKSVIFSFVIIFFYGMGFFLYAKPTAFNSRQMTWHFNPFIYPDGSNFMAYFCLITVLNNEGAVSLNLILTFLFVGVFFYKSIVYQFKMGATQKQIFLQSCVCNINNLIGASIFVSYQFVDGGRVLNYIGLLCWQFCPIFELTVFLFINKTIRQKVMVLLGRRKAVVHTSKYSLTNPGNARVSTFSKH